MNRIVGENITAVIFGLIMFLFTTRTVRAQVVINEFSSNSNPEWVELYNVGPTDINLTGWKLVDEANHIENLSGVIPGNGFFVFERLQGWLNNSGGDAINLKDASDDLINSVIYGHSGDAVGTPDADKSTGRIPGASDVWQMNLTWTIGSGNFKPTPTPSPNPTQTPSKAIYKINKPEDGAGSELTSVQIYVDGHYIHHEDDEILEFYPGNECYLGISCDFGIHIISLRKDNYTSWEDTRDLLNGMNMEVNPVLNKQVTISPTPSPSPIPPKTPAPTPTRSTTPVATQTPSSTPINITESTVLGEGVTVSSPQAPEPAQNLTENPKVKFPLAAVGLVILGTGLIGFSVFSIIKSAKKSYNTESEGKNNQIS